MSETEPKQTEEEKTHRRHLALRPLTRQMTDLQKKESISLFKSWAGKMP